MIGLVLRNGKELSMPIIGGMFVVGGLYLCSLYNYLLFHGLVELFCVIVAAGMFMMAWEAHRFTGNLFVSYLGIAYLFVGTLDALHLFAYDGMGVFPGYDANLPTQFWIAGRYLESVSMCAALYMSTGKYKFSARVMFLMCALAFGLLVALIFSGIFPDCYIKASGLTPFKKQSEYLISVILLISALMLRSRRHLLDATLIKFLYAAIFTTIASELVFTFYISVYGISNLIGHMLKGISYYLLYRAFIKTGIENQNRMLEYARKEWEDIFQAIVHPTFIIGKDHSILAANRAALKSSGLTREEMTTRKCFDVFHQSKKPPQVCLMESMCESGRCEPTETEKDVFGGKYLVSCTPVLDDQGNFRKTIHIATDITKRKRAEIALQDAYGQLEKKVGERTAELMHAMEAAEVANKAKSMFIANISHELRTPLNAIFGLGQLMVNDRDIPDRHRENLKLIHENGKILMRIINQVLELSKIGGGRLALGRSYFDFQELMGEVESVVRPLAEEKRLEFTVIHDMGTLRYIASDRSKLRQILVSLLDNAVKFTKTGKIILRVKSEKTLDHEKKPSHSRLCFEIEDTGPGIPRDDREHIFETFVQSPDGKGKPKGIGLGLPISREIVRLMEGNISVVSQVGKGTTFAFDIPIFAAADCDTPGIREFPVQPVGIEEAAESEKCQRELGKITEKLTCLPSDLLAQIEKDVIEGNHRKALKDIREARVFNEEIGDILGEMVENFQYKEILALIRESGNEV